MAMQIKFTTPSFHLVGDGVATIVSLSIFEFPFVGAPNSRPVSVTVIDGGDHVISASVSDTLITLTFDSAFSGDNGGCQLTVTFQV